MKKGLLLTLSILFLSLVLCQAITINNIPSSKYVIASEGEETSLYCFILDDMSRQVQTTWLIQKLNESLIGTEFNGSTGEVTVPSEFTGQFTATGELIPGISQILTYQTNFTLLNFTRDFDLAEITCGTGNPGENFIYTIGLPGNLY